MNAALQEEPIADTGRAVRLGITHRCRFFGSTAGQRYGGCVNSMPTKTALAKLRRVGAHKIAEDRDDEENRPPDYHRPERCSRALPTTSIERAEW